MKSLVINNRTYRYADRLEELTLEQWQALMRFHFQKNTHPEGQRPEQTQAATRILTDFAGIDEKIVLKTAPDERTRFLNDWSETIARQYAGTGGKPDPEALRATARAACKKARLFWPRDAYTLDHTRQPLSGIRAQAFCDATDLYLENPIEQAHIVMAILCRPPRKAYDEMQILRDAAKMKRHSMKVVLGLFGELTQAHRLFRNWFPACYRNRLQESKEPGNRSQNPPRWNDILLWLAEYRPSEIKLAEQLPCYEFMRMADGKLRNRQSTFTPKTTPPHV